MSATPAHRSTSQGLSITKAKADDVGAISDLVTSAYSKYIDRMGKKPAPMLMDYAKVIEEGHEDVFVLTREEAIVAADGEGNDSKKSKVVGSILLSNVAESNAIQINSLVVDPTVQRSGYGRMLMDYAEEVARARGLKAIVLYTNIKMVENLSYYAKLGYQETGRRTEDGFDRVYFRKELQ